MNNAVVKPSEVDEDLHMGSEYASARAYLAQTPRAESIFSVKRKPKVEPQHGSNDSDFGIPDQRHD